MSIKEVTNFIRKSGPKALALGHPKVEKTLKDCLLELKGYIDGTIDEFLGTSVYDDLYIASWIYRDSLNSDAEVEEYIKVNLFAAKRSLNNIISHIGSLKGGLTYTNIKQNSELIKDFILDIRKHIDYYKRKTDPTFEFFLGWKSYTTSSFETYKIAQTLFYNSGLKTNPLPFKASQGMVAIALRQSIEIKTKRILGIYRIEKVNKKIPEYSFKELFKFIEANKVDIEYDPIDFQVLKLIHKWSCSYIHNGDTSYIWQTEHAFNYLKTFFALGTYSAGSSTMISVFGAFKLSNFDNLKVKLRVFVGQRYSIDFLSDHLVEAVILSH